MTSVGKRHKISKLLTKTPLAAAVAAAMGASPVVHADDLPDASSPASDASASSSTETATPIATVTVTATGRAEKASDIPYNISVMDASDLEKAGVTDIPQLSRQVPGLNYTDLGARSNGVANGIIIRGLNGNPAGLNNQSLAIGDPTVSTYINNTPLFANLKINDVDRVEILRGPQGTLYGAGSVGGTLRFILNKPDPSGFYGDVQAQVSGTAHSDDPSYGTDLMLNIPLASNLALRISSGYDKMGGYTDADHLMEYDANGSPVLADSSDYFGSDAVYTKKKDVDGSDTYNNRVSLLWNISDASSLLLTYGNQNDHANDYSGESPYETKSYTTTRNRLSPIHNVSNMFSAEYNQDFGFATFTSSSSYTQYDVDSNTDYTNFADYSSSWYAGFPRSSYSMDIDNTTKRYTQEFRLVSKPGGPWDWVAGLYYDHYKQNSSIDGKIPGWSEYTNTAGHPTAVAALGDADATWADYYQSFYPDGTFDTDDVYILTKALKYENTAAYGDVTYHLTDAWQVTGGARVFHVSNDQWSLQDLPYWGSTNDLYSTHSSSDTNQIFKLNTSYKLNPDNMVYATWSQGYRQGGSNALPTIGRYASNASIVEYKNDRADNWEVGMKGTLLNRIQYSTALFRINWKDMQLQIPAPQSGIPCIVNAGDAISEGFEMELKANLTDRLSSSLGYTYTDAHVTQTFSAASGYTGNDGDTLPGVPMNTLNVGLDYNQPLTWFGRTSHMLYHVDGATRSSVHTALNASDTDYVALGGFTTWNASVTWQGSALRVGVFGDNLTSQKGITAADVSNDTTPGSRPGSLYFTKRPRTVGLKVGYSF